jgi:hypothetical protein
VRTSGCLWEAFRDELRTQHDDERGNLMICAFVRGNPFIDLHGRRIATIVDSSGSNQQTGFSSLRVAAAKAFIDRIITKDEANPRMQAR